MIVRRYASTVRALLPLGSGSVTNFATWMLLSLTVIGIVVLLVGRGRVTLADLSFDARQYLSMSGADTGVAVVHEPFRSRILTPAIVRLLPVDPLAGFRIVTYLSLGLLLLVFRYYLVELGLTNMEQVAGFAVLASLFYPTVYSVHNPFLVDPLSFLLLQCGLLAIIVSADWFLTLVLIVGSFNKETIFMLTPAYLLVASLQSGWRGAVRKAVLATSPAFIVYLIVVRQPSDASNQTAFGSLLISEIHSIVGSPNYFRRLLSAILLSGGALWPSAVLGIRWAKPLIIRLTVGFCLGIMPLLIMASDSGRMLGLASFVWIPLSLLCLRQLAKRWKQTTWIIGIILGNAGLVAATLVILPGWLEAGLRLAGITLIFLPTVAVASNVWKAPASVIGSDLGNQHGP